MTNEEARRILLDIADQMPSDVCADWIDAIGLGIKALEQQPSEDCISRQAVIRLVEQYPNIIGNRCSGLIADIKHLPSVTPRTNLAETSQDCISRQAVLNSLFALCDTGETLKENPWRDNPHIDALVDSVEDLPSVTPQQRWIPVKQELPENNKEVLCYSPFAGIFIGTYFEGVFDGDSGWTDDVVAWMPLPQPYKEDKE